jgi:rod shape-determining protein MreD
MARRKDNLPSLSYERKLTRRHSPVLARSVPYVTILLGSLLPSLALTNTMPFFPPFGFMLLLAWRLYRPGFMPMWVGLPLGAFDDLFSGQPMGSAILLWSITMIVLDYIEQRFPWRGFWQDWFVAAIAVSAYLIIAIFASGTVPTLQHFAVVAPQVLLSVLLYPIIAIMVAGLDRMRLVRFRELD